MNTSHSFRWIVAFLALSACVPSNPTASVEQVQTAIAETAAVLQVSTPTPTPSPPPSPSPQQLNPSTPNPTITLPPSEPIAGEVNVLFLNMRQGPGTMFDVINTYQEGTQVSALGRVQENDWIQVQVQNNEGETELGWMYAVYVKLEEDILKLPAANFPESLKISGRVEDINGEPLPEITVAILFESPQVILRSDVISSPSGDFIGYLPEDLFGNLDVQIFAHGCTSPVMDEDCHFSDYIQLDNSFFVPIPQEFDIIFRYQPTTLILEGIVRNRGGSPLEGIDIIAERDDGARSFGISMAEGTFTIPIDEGIWKVYTRDAETGKDGPAISISVTNENPEAIELTAP